MNDRSLELMGLSIELACHEKWREGRKLYGTDGFVGEPMVELHSEGIDAMNYIAEERHRGRLPEEILYHLEECAIELVRGSRLAAEKLGIEPARPMQSLPLDAQTDKPGRRNASIWGDAQFTEEPT